MHVCTLKNKFKAKSLKRQEVKKQNVRSDRHSFTNNGKSETGQ